MDAALRKLSSMGGMGKMHGSGGGMHHHAMVMKNMSRGVLFAVELASTSRVAAKTSTTGRGEFQYVFEQSTASVVSPVDRQDSLESLLGTFRRLHSETATKRLETANQNAQVLAPVDLSKVLVVAISAKRCQSAALPSSRWIEDVVVAR
jgi:hypothetical protein